MRRLAPFFVDPATGAAMHGAAGAPSINAQPVLVDFASTILDRDAIMGSAGQSVVPRRAAGWKSSLRRLVFGGNRVAEENARRLVDTLCADAPGARPIVLIVGGGSVGPGAEYLYACDKVDVVAFDIYASHYTDFIADAHKIPLSDDVNIDAVWIQAVLEHVLDPAQVAQEIHRVLKPGGLVYAETPFMQPVHEGAYDFTRFTELGHRWLFRHFETIDSGAVSGPGAALFWSIRYFVAALLRNRTLGTLVAAPFFWLRFLDRLADKRFASDAACGVFFMGRASDAPLKASAAPAAFNGAPPE